LKAEEKQRAIYCHSETGFLLLWQHCCFHETTLDWKGEIVFTGWSEFQVKEIEVLEITV
jgi:hypothetical protein